MLDLKQSVTFPVICNEIQIKLKEWGFIFSDFPENSQLYTQAFLKTYQSFLIVIYRESEYINAYINNIDWTSLS